jgi:hypothetical protein
MKKEYNAPKLTVHGDMETLTQMGGFSATGRSVRHASWPRRRRQRRLVNPL